MNESYAIGSFIGAAFGAIIVMVIVRKVLYFTYFRKYPNEFKHAVVSGAGAIFICGLASFFGEESTEMFLRNFSGYAFWCVLWIAYYLWKANKKKLPL